MRILQILILPCFLVAQGPNLTNRESESVLQYLVCRKMWAEGINLSKTSISNEQANAMCKDLLVKGASLRDVLKSESDPILTPELRELISGCRNFVDVAANLDDSMHDAKKDMNSLLDEIKTLCDDKTGSVISTNIVEWLSKQWNLDSDIPAEEVDLLLNSLEPLPKIAQALSLRGLGYLRRSKIYKWCGI